MAQSEILLSVIMANYNHVHYLETRLNSILSQIPLNSEIVLIDDASTDDSVLILEEMAKKDSRLRVFQNPRNLGAVATYNVALQYATGKYICSMAADDVALPGFFEKTLNLLQKHPEVGIGCSDCASLFVGFPNKDPAKIYSAHLIKNATMPLVFHAEQMVTVFWTTEFWIPGHTAIAKRDLLLKYGGFHERLGHLCDWFLWHTIALSAGVVYIPETLSVWREEMKSYSHQLGSHRNKERTLCINLLEMLMEPENKHVCQNFKTSGLLYPFIRRHFMYLCARPKFWTFLWHFFKKYLANRWRQRFKLTALEK